MEISEYKNIFENEEYHFFYVANSQLIHTLAANALCFKQKKIRILDAGCGTGFLAKKLEKLGKVVGVDISSHALHFAKKRAIEVRKASVEKLPFKKNAFDLVVSVDVIYHKDVLDDKKALKEFFRVLKRKGTLILRVPANKWLRLSHDKFVHTRQRYSKEELMTTITSAGFVIEKLTFVNGFLLPLAVIRYVLERMRPKQKASSVVTRLPWLFNKALLILLLLENKLVLSTGLPFGLGLLAVCRKSK